MERDHVIAGVTDTLLDFCEWGDEGRLDDWTSLFCEDGRFGRFEGRARIRKIGAYLMSTWSASSHHISNIRVEPVTEVGARSTCYVYAWHQRTDGTQYESWGRYIDTLRFEGDRWRFANRQPQMAGYRGIGDQGVPPVPRAAGPFA